MDFRRIPFNFTTTDPLKRQEELQRRFGLPANKGNMYVDFANSGAMSARPDMGSASNSPRLQHRVPIFVEGQSEPSKPSVDAQNVDTGRKPHVRVIPIEIEGEDNASKRHRWLSGSSEPIKERVGGAPIPVETLKHSVQDSVPQSPKAPRVCNIPIKIEGNDHVIRPKSPIKTQKIKTPESPKHTGVKLNGCSASKVAKVNKQKESCKVDEKKESPEQVTLKKIQNVEEKLKVYHADVENFSGTNKEKQYRYLDEMLTRCMLELDEIDTLGLDTIRLARKAVVKKVQASIDLLESKIIKEGEQNQVIKEPMEVEPPVDQLPENFEVADMKAVGVDTQEIQNSRETDLIGIGKDDQVNVEMGNANDEMTDALPEQINEKVENISIIENADTEMKSDERESASNNSSEETSVTDEKMNIEITEPVQIAEVEVGVDNFVISETEPVVEEPLSDSKDANAVDMDLDSCNCENDLKLDDPPSVQICEVEDNTLLDPNELKDGTIGQSGQNIETEVIKSSDIPVITEQTVLSSANQTVVDSCIPTVSSNSNNDSVSINDVPTN